MAGRNIVGNNIRKLRIKARLTQEELALKSGLSQGYINQLESGKRRFTQKSLDMIKDALSVSMEELFRGSKVNVAGVKRVPGRTPKKRPSKREFLTLLNELPDHIVEHYLILLKMEKEIWKKRKTP